jgi:hypothetical protein
VISGPSPKQHSAPLGAANSETLPLLSGFANRPVIASTQPLCSFVGANFFVPILMDKNLSDKPPSRVAPISLTRAFLNQPDKSEFWFSGLEKPATSL